MEAGQDADICKRSDTDLERFLWLAREHRREAPTWLSEHGGGGSPAHGLNLYISVVYVYRSLKPGDYWNLFFFFLCVCYL